MTPTVGRIVHYTNLGDKDGKYPPETQAAIITSAKSRIEGEPGKPPMHPEGMFIIDLHVFYRTGNFFMLDVPFSSEPARGHWNWPPRV